MLTMDERISPFIATVQKYYNQSTLTLLSPWFQSFRGNALNRFLALGIPTIQEEDWKYTNLSELNEITFNLDHQSGSLSKPRLQKFISTDELTIVFVNGIFRKDLSNIEDLPDSVEFLTLSRAIEKDKTELPSLYGRYLPQNENSFVCLNHALAGDGVFLSIADKISVKKLIHILHITQTQDRILTLPKTVILSGQSSEATVLETHIGLDSQKYLSVPLTDIYLKDNAVLHYCKAQSESLDAYHIGNTRVWQEKDSHFDGFSLMNGAAVTRNDLDIVSDGEGTSSTLNGFYGVNGKQHVDNHSSMDHRQPNCTSNQLYKGILNGESHSAFNGKIFVRQIAQKTNSYQLNKNLLLGEKCRVDTKPQLEIFADDVKCTHGATIGQLNEDEIFYLQTRCISKKEAVKLLAHGFVQDILNKIHAPAIIAKLTALLEPTFAALE